MMLGYIAVSSCEMNKDKDLLLNTQKTHIPNLNMAFGTLKVYTDIDHAQSLAASALDREIERLKAKGYTLRCAPKTIDVDNHDWRRIARVGKPGKPSLCLQAMVRWIDDHFDPWIC